MAVVSMSYLLEAGVHFGHQTKSKDERIHFWGKRRYLYYRP